MEEEKQSPAEKQDMVDRKMAWAERVFDKLFAATKENVFATLLVLAVIGLFWQQGIINDINESRISDKDKSNDKFNAAVEKYVDRILPEKLAPYQAQQDSLKKNVDTSLLNVNGTIESVKRYIKKVK